MKRNIFKHILPLTLGLMLVVTGCDTSKPKESTQKEPEIIYETEEGILAKETIQPATKFAGGDGSAESPYQIADASQLALLAANVNSED